MRRIATVLVLSLGAPAGATGEETIVLKPGPGRDKVEAHCAACHSLDYIVMNSPFLTRAQWQAEVTKMIEGFKAPIAPSDAKQITDYLGSAYGG
jgi:mono/diheme cytochrome c family protein